MPGADGQPFSRRVDAATCGEVELALSLVLALAYDPDAITTFPEAATVAPPPATPPPPLRLPPPPAPAEPAEPPFALAFGAAVTARSGIGPGMTPVLGPFVEWGLPESVGFSPSISAALLFSTNRDTTPTDTGRTATLQYFGGRLLGCPVSLQLTRAVSAGACLSIDAGLIVGVAGAEVESGRAGTLRWLSAGALAKIRWKIVDPIFVEAAGGGGLPFFHEKFGLTFKTEPVYTIPDAFGEVGASLGIHFP
jgi:hypothetical protein